MIDSFRNRETVWRVRCLLMLCTALFSSSLCAQVSIKSSFTPATISQGENATYSIIVSGSQDQLQGGVPQVDGMQLQFAGRQQFYKMINGRNESGVNYQFMVSVQKPGTYALPPFQVKIGSTSYTVPGATLKVVPAEDRYAQGEGKAYWFDHEPMINQYYTGQLIPMELNLYIRDDVRITGYVHPEKRGDAFSMIPLNEHHITESETIVQGSRYKVYTWHTAITPLKNGLQDLGFTIQIELLVNDSSSRRRRDFFDSPFDDIFGRSGKRMRLNLESTPYQLDIQPVPAADRPASYSGAIGLFSMDDIVLSDQLSQAGEPITLTLRIHGEGNFDRMEPPKLTHTEGWQTYEPETTFIAEDQLGLGLAGTKQFDYTIIPTSKATTQSPGVTFSYFDPKSATFVSFDAKPQQVEVIAAKSSGPIVLPPTLNPEAASSNTANTAETPKAKQLELLPIQLVPGKWSRSSGALIITPLFLLFQLVCCTAIAGVFYVRKHQQKLAGDTRYARKLKARKSVQDGLLRAQQAAKENDGNQFYAAATVTIQALVGGLTGQEPESLTLPEVEDYLLECGTRPEQLVLIHSIFEANDALKFSGGAAPLADASEHYAQLENLIKELQTIL